MDRTGTVEAIQKKYRMLSFVLDEKTRRLWAASEATSVGWGGVSIVSEATGLAHTTIRRGVRDLEGVALSADKIVGSARVRRAGAGRKNIAKLIRRFAKHLSS